MEDLTSEEFYTIAKQVKTRGRRLSPESMKLMSLKVGEGFLSPCRWIHSPSCRGLNFMHVVARRNSVKVTTQCVEKNLYVLRIN